ncbi:MAG: hypothetical protein ACN0LA_13500 [Candidatus Longimicrobiales bacterium M2_2A_002]
MNASRIGIIAGALLLLPFAACTTEYGPDDSAGGTEESSAEAVEGTGTVVWRTVEGGLYVIEADNGTTYEPLTLPSEFRVDSLRVSFEGEIRTDVASIHMVGPLLEITAIQAL